jgi:dienelactone hydrolase
MRDVALATLLAVLGMLACVSDPAPEPDSPDPDPTPSPALPAAHCGTDYQLLPAGALGDALNWEEIPAFDLSAGELDVMVNLAGFGALTPVKHGVRVFRFRYTTQDQGQAIEATGMIGLPQPVAVPDERAPVALVLHGFAGASDACAPSEDGLIGPMQVALLAADGFVAVAPDFIGLNGRGGESVRPHAPLLGEQVAIGSWDAMRAARSLLAADLGVRFPGEARNDVVIWGASQGGHAAFFTELFGPYYGGEEVRGVVAASPAHNLMDVVVDAMDVFAPATGLSALALIGWRRWYGVPESMHGVLSNTEPYYLADTAEALIESSSGECVFEGEFDADEPSDVYEQDFIDAVQVGDWDAIEPWSCFLRANSVSTTSVPRLSASPVLTVYGELDDLVIPQVQHADWEQLCADGWTLDHLECEGAGHAEATLFSIPEQLAWLRDRIADVPLAGVCQWREPVCCAGSTDEACGG